jgi:hypothetical protein
MNDFKMAPPEPCACQSQAPDESKPEKQRSVASQVGLGVFGIALWGALYSQLLPLAEWLTGKVFGLDLSSHLGEAVRFFLYDTPKVLLLLILIVFFVGVLRSFFTPEATRKLLAGKKEIAGNGLAALLGVATPFCSCSAVPLFVGFVTAGVPLGVTFSFLIAAPMVNEVALVLLYGLFGWKVAALYMGTGLGVAVVAGWVIGKLNMEKYLQDWVRNQLFMGGSAPQKSLTWSNRINAGVASIKDIVGKVWPYVIAGIAAGAIIHGYVPQDFMASVMGRDAWWSVPLAVVMGIPMYTNAAGVVPVIHALIGKGAALGTALAFMMSVIALSLPEMLILKKVLKPRLIATFIGVVGLGILLVGYLFNAIL